MDRQEVALLGFEIVAYAGDAKSKLMEALKEAQAGNYDKAEELVEVANQLIVQAHKSQTGLLQEEASGKELPFSVTLIHGQDHLMTTILLKDLMKHLIELYRRG